MTDHREDESGPRQDCERSLWNLACTYIAHETGHQHEFETRDDEESERSDREYHERGLGMWET